MHSICITWIPPGCRMHIAYVSHEYRLGITCTWIRHTDENHVHHMHRSPNMESSLGNMMDTRSVRRHGALVKILYLHISYMLSLSSLSDINAICASAAAFTRKVRIFLSLGTLGRSSKWNMEVSNWSKPVWEKRSCFKIIFLVTCKT